MPTQTEAVAQGDLNQDGQVNVLDAQRSVNVFLGEEADPEIVAWADVNSDGAVNVLDVQFVVNPYLGSSQKDPTRAPTHVCSRANYTDRQLRFPTIKP